MKAPIIEQRNIDFMLYELFDAQQLTSRQRYDEHTRETFDAAIATARTIAEKTIVPMRLKADTQQPALNGDQISLIPQVKQAVDAVMASGLAIAECDFAQGGIQLPAIIYNAAYGYLAAAGGALMGYIALTTA